MGQGVEGIGTGVWSSLASRWQAAEGQGAQRAGHFAGSLRSDAVPVATTNLCLRASVCHDSSG